MPHANLNARIPAGRRATSLGTPEMTLSINPGGTGGLLCSGNIWKHTRNCTNCSPPKFLKRWGTREMKGPCGFPPECVVSRRAGKLARIQHSLAQNARTCDHFLLPLFRMASASCRVIGFIILDNPYTAFVEHSCNLALTRIMCDLFATQMAQRKMGSSRWLRRILGDFRGNARSPRGASGSRNRWQSSGRQSGVECFRGRGS